MIEAVVEQLDVKRDSVCTKVEKLDAPRLRYWRAIPVRCSSATWPTTPSAASGLVGIHFFNPVAKMPLVEIVRTAHSDDQSLATAIGLATRIGKTPVLVNDAPGFLVNRVLIPYWPRRSPPQSTARRCR